MAKYDRKLFWKNDEANAVWNPRQKQTGVDRPDLSLFQGNKC